MVESIGVKTVTTTQDRLVVPNVTTVSQTANAAANASAKPNETATKQLELSAVAFDFGKVSPMEEKRVEEVKRAVRNGTYPIAPETIADRMLALKLYWSPKK
jgi:negative regulator of flagellin synthesis FlgM